MDNTEKVEIISQENLRNFDRNDPLIKRIIDGSDKLRPDGLIKTDGSVNWLCPCMGNLFYGPCGPNFRKVFQCIVDCKNEEANSKDVKMEDLIVQNCMDKFSELAKCQNTFSNYYKGKGDEFNEVLSKEMI